MSKPSDFHSAAPFFVNTFVATTTTQPAISTYSCRHCASWQLAARQTLNSDLRLRIRFKINYQTSMLYTPIYLNCPTP